MKNNTVASTGLVEVLAQSLVNPMLRAKALNSPEQLAVEYGLSPLELDTLRKTCGASFENASLKLGGETTALVKGHVGAGQTQMVTRRRESAPLAMAA